MPSKIVYVPHYNVVGSPTISDDYIASSLSGSNYFQSTESIPSTANTWELGIKFHTGTSFTGTAQYFAGQINGTISVGLWEGGPATNFGNGSWFNGAVNLDTTYAANTDYWYRVSFDGTKYSIKRSTDGENFTEIAYLTNSNHIATTLVDIGYQPGSLFTSIDLKEVYMKVDGVETWRAVTEEVIDVSGSVSISKGYYDSGSAKIIMPASTVSLTDLKSGETVGCKNKLFAYSKNNVAGVKITGSANADITTAHDVSVDLNKSIYLDHTKNYIAGGALIEPVWSFSNGGTTPNFVTTGSLTFGADGEVSGFSSSNTLKLDRIFTATSTQSFEVSFKIKTGSYTGGIQEIFAMFPPLLLRTNSNRWNLPYNTGSWNDSQQDYVSSETVYFVKILYYPTTTTVEGVTYTGKYLYFEVYDSSKTLLYRYNYSLTGNFLNFQNAEAYLGSQGGSGEHWGGSIFLDENAYIKVDGELFWEPYTAIAPGITTQKALVYDNANDKTFWYPSETSVTLTDEKSKQTVGMKNNLYLTNIIGSPTASITFCEGTPAGVTEYYQQPKYVWLNSSKDTILGVQEEPDEIVVETAAEPVANYTVVGSPTVDSDWIASNFSSSGLVAKETLLDNSYETFEIRAKVTTGSTSGNQIFFADTHSNACSVALNVKDGRFCLYLSSNGSSFDIANEVSGSQTINSGATYYVKLTFNGSSYVMSFSSDGVSYTDTVTVNSTTKIATLTPTIGSWVRGGTTPDSSYFQGSVDLKEYSVLADGVEVWRAVSEGIITGVAASSEHYWTWLLSSTYNAKGKSLEASSMSGTALSGSLMVMPSGVLAYSENNSQGSLMDAFTGYTVTFTDTAHTSIASLTKTGTRCRTYYCEEQSTPTPINRYIYVESLPPTGDLKTSTSSFEQREITPTETLSSYEYDSTTDTISYNGHTAIYAGDCYINL